MATRSQSRSAVTRQEIIDAAVDLFVDHGYGDTRLQDIVERAGVTTGAFYYHFDSKEDLAWAIIDQGWPKAAQILETFLAAPHPALENVILMTFSISALLQQNRTAWISNHLNGGFGQLNQRGRREFKDHAQAFITRVAEVVPATDLRPEMSPREVGNLVWIVLHGCHLLSDALMDDPIERLKNSWAALLPAMVPTESLAHYEQIVGRTAARYREASGAGNQRPS